MVTDRKSPPQRGVSALLLLLLELLSALDNYFTRDPKLHTGWPYFRIVAWNHPWSKHKNGKLHLSQVRVLKNEG